ncbi:hypothetical protein EC991_009628 [Linnemannia zychae]|nr:hypothetical protein EC991_009628 [Linnemannia zychae]
MSNPMFDDFIELDLLDASDPANAMFASFYLGDTTDIHDDNDINNLAPVVDTTSTTATTATESDAASTQGLVIKTEPSDSPMLLNPIPLSPQQTLASDESPLIFDTDMTMITPDQLTIAPHDTTVSPSSLSTSTSGSMATISTAAATASPTTTRSAVAIDSSKSLKPTTAASSSTSTIAQSSSKSLSSPATSAPAASTSNAKRASPEPATTPARKHAKTDSVSSSKAKSSSASKKSSSASTTSNAAVATKATSGAAKSTASSSSTASTTPSATKGKSQSPEPTAESLTSTANTTLSAATLQFLLQQQVETPLIPQLFTGKLTREEIEETLARLLESTKHLVPTSDEELPVKVKEEPVSDDESDNEMEGVEPTSTADGAEPSHGLKTQPGIKTDDIPSSTDLKKMTSKERRQLRNKISARNFRVRRKEYIYTLEGQVLQHKTEARHLREAVTLMQDENQRLKEELDTVRRQLEATTLASAATTINTATFEPTSTDPTLSSEPSTPLSKENQSLLTSIMNRNVSAAMNPNAKSNITLSMARPQSPILTPNLHKDVPNSSSGSTSQSSWKDKNPIMVHRTLIPEICFGDEFQFDSKPSSALDAVMMDRPWMTFDPKPIEPLLTDAPFTVSELVLELMQTFTCMSANMSPLSVDTTDESVEADPESDLDWELQQNLWALTQVEQEDDMTEEQIQLVYDLVQCQTSTSRPLSPMQEDPNMLEWLYESMMARLVDLDLQDSQHSTLPESHMA